MTDREEKKDEISDDQAIGDARRLINVAEKKLLKEIRQLHSNRPTRLFAFWSGSY